MTVPPISFVPEGVPLELYAGDGATIVLALFAENDDAIDLEGTVAASIKLRREDTTALLDFGVTVEGNEATLTLSGDQTQQLGEFVGAWDVEWVSNGSAPVTLVQGKATCKLDVTRA